MFSYKQKQWSFFSSFKESKKIIKNLDPNKVHRHDMTSIQMIKIYNVSICKPLELIFRSCLENGKFPTEWKKANVVPDKQNMENYHPISIFAFCCWKNIERIFYNNMYEFFTENNLISLNQSFFKLGDSCINQVLSITHEI